MLVDTSALIDYFDGTPGHKSDVFDAALAEGPPPVTVGIIVQEFLQGFRARELEHARRAVADLHRRAGARGITASTVDALIVQLAAEHGLPLLTCDRVQAALAGVAGVRLARASGSAPTPGSRAEADFRIRQPAARIEAVPTDSRRPGLPSRSSRYGS